MRFIKPINDLMRHNNPKTNPANWTCENIEEEIDRTKKAQTARITDMAGTGLPRLIRIKGSIVDGIDSYIKHQDKISDLGKTLDAMQKFRDDNCGDGGPNSLNNPVHLPSMIHAPPMLKAPKSNALIAPAPVFFPTFFLIPFSPYSMDYGVSFLFFQGESVQL